MLRDELITPAMSDADAAAFEMVRPRLFGIAYRVLGSAADADDIVQDAWIRWHRTDRGDVRDAAAFLATTTTRLAINARQSAHARRETPAGPWLEAAFGDDADPALDAERAEALAAAVGTLHGSLPAAERAAYVLREAFEYPYRQIGERLGVTEANARQIVTRARRRLATTLAAA